MFDLLLTVVVTVRNEEKRIAERLQSLGDTIAGLLPDYEIVVVDNASSDKTAASLETLSREMPNLEVYCLSTLVSQDGAVIAGIEQSIGDHIIVVENLDWDFSVIPAMVEHSIAQSDIVFATGQQNSANRSARYRILSTLFVRLYRTLTGVDLRAEVPRFRLFNRRVANFVMQHRSPELVYQVVPRMAGFKRDYVQCESPSTECENPGLLGSINRAVGLLVATSVTPIRLVSVACLMSAFISVLYSLYVVSIYLLKDDVAPGWTTLSLQLSVTFFLLSMALGILSEYVVYISNLTSRPPRYHIAREFTSNVTSRKQKLNVLLDNASPQDSGEPERPSFT